MWPLAVLTGDHINKGFCNKKLYGPFTGPKKLSNTCELFVASLMRHFVSAKRLFRDL